MARDNEFPLPQEVDYSCRWAVGHMLFASVIWLVMKEVLVLLGIGLAIGLPAAIGLGTYVASQLYGIQAHDPFMAVATIVTLALVSAAAGLIPARRASRIDPILALRYE